jgi:hypothetical protein
VNWREREWYGSSGYAHLNVTRLINLILALR